MELPPVEKGRLLRNRPLYIDTLFYGTVIAALSLANFVFVAYFDGAGVANTRSCNYELVRDRRMKAAAQHMCVLVRCCKDSMSMDESR